MIEDKRSLGNHQHGSPFFAIYDLSRGYDIGNLHYTHYQSHSTLTPKRVPESTQSRNPSREGSPDCSLPSPTTLKPQASPVRPGKSRGGSRFPNNWKVVVAQSKIYQISSIPVVRGRHHRD